MVYNYTVEEIFPNILSASSQKSNESIRRLAVVLNAVTDVVKTKNAPIQPASYFALIISTLQDGNYQPSQKQDLLKLLSIVIERVSQQLIRNISDTLITMSMKYMTEEFGNEEIMKPCVVVLGRALTHSDTQSWQTSEHIKAYALLLKCSVDQRSKIRQKALKEVILVLNSSGVCGPRGGLIKIVAQVSTNFCRDIFSNITLETMGEAYHALNVSHELVPLLQPSFVSQLMDSIIRLTSLGNSSITPLCYKTIGTLFFRTNQLIGTHIQQLIEVLFQFSPSGIDIRSTIAYTELITQAYLHFSRLDKQLCNQHLQNYFTTLMSNFSSDKQDITKVTMDGFKNVIVECINEEMISQATVSLKNQQFNSPLEKIIETLMEGLKYTYKHSWELILQVISSMFQQLGSQAHPLLDKLLLGVDSLGGLQHTVQQVIASALVAIGARNLLTLLPLNLDAHPDDKTRPNRGFLLQLMKKHLKFSELAAFTDYFLPMSKVLKTKSNECLEDNRLIEAKNLDILYIQVWQLLPGFLTYPVDGDTAFKSIAKTLGTTLQDNEVIRPIVCTGLTTMINTLKAARDADQDPIYLPLHRRHVTMSPTRAAAILKTVAGFAKNFLPIMFNIYPSTKNDIRQYLQACIEAYVSIADATTVNNLFNNIVTKLLEAQKEEEETRRLKPEEKIKTKRYYLTELTMGFIKRFAEQQDVIDEVTPSNGSLEQLNTLFKVIKPQFQAQDPGIQKRTFKVLDRIMAHHPAFTMENLDKLKTILTFNLQQSSPNLKKLRIRCIKQAVQAILEYGDTSQSEQQLQQDFENAFTQGNQQGEEGAEETMETRSTISFGGRSMRSTRSGFSSFGSRGGSSAMAVSWTKLRQKLIPSLVPEIILCTKEVNKKCKEMSNDLVIEMGKVMCLVAQRCIQLKKGIPREQQIQQAQSEALVEYIHLMAAGLASITPMMVSATIVAISRVVHSFRDLLPLETVSQMLSTLFVLMDSPHREVVKSVMGFTRVVMACFRENSVIEPHLQMLMDGLSKSSESDRNYFRIMIQILLQRLMKRFDYDQLHAMSQEGFKKVLVHIQRRKMRAEKLKEKQQSHVDDAMADDDDTRSVKSSKTAKTSKTSKTGAGRDDDSDGEIVDNELSEDESDDDIEEFLFNVKKAAKRDTGDNWIVGEGDEPIDYLDRSAMNNIASNESGKVRIRKPNSVAEKTPISKYFDTDGEGRMIIEDEDQPMDPRQKMRELKKKRSMSALIDEVFEEGADAYEKKAGYRAMKQKSINKRANNENDDSDDSGNEDQMDEDLKSAFTKRTFATKFTTKTGKTAKTAKTTKTSLTNITRITSATDRYNRTRGISTNVNFNNPQHSQKKGEQKKGANAVQPYAYIPLDTNTLNKRTKHLSAFKTVVNNNKKRKS
ncbi:hypothetical protein DFA_09709 [Cavenderia fasciculata]|uniref:Ribosomal RNA-processing protein 12-like conserved domain-containing protein n=1 Tax=Cavenderia fasciculata TaxID=261658 RepID=F4Q8D7_CACFS|nr:uncharacterized protein DFA_09709 [Cavenderia fasciculata]EGG16037.1 hypothetical protein DFA_09709 [Cavenderia fasciculata]|eukprot:XP_004352362.1 hypothetical protein DFA_09709 [Cavenderia fasciculata]